MENEVRLIDANALQRRICKAKCKREYEDCREEGDCEFDFFIFFAPTIDPESLRPKGRWVYDDGNLEWACSECLCEAHISWGAISGYNLSDFCPNCGAKMEDFNG